MIYTRPVYTMSAFLQKDGYDLKKVFCDVYSLSADRLVELAVYVENADGENVQEYDLRDLCFGVEELKKRGDRGRLVVHTNAYPYPAGDRILNQNALEIWNRCGKVVRLKGGSYHPKLLLACFQRGSSDAWYYRLQVSTGNMTASGSMDLSVVVEGGTQPHGQQANGGVLLSFYEKVYETLGEDFPAAVLNGLRHTEFRSCFHDPSVVADIGNVRFAYTYPKGGDSDQNRIKNRLAAEAGGQEVYVYSPFLRFDRDSGSTYLDQKLAAAVYHTNLTAELCEAWDVLRRKERAVFYCSKNGPFFHAKLYMWKLKAPGNRYRVWLGSANASQNGWEKNAEFAVGFDLEIKRPDADGICVKTDVWTYKRFNGDQSGKSVSFGNACPEAACAFHTDQLLYWVRLLPDRIRISAKACGDGGETIALSICVDGRGGPQPPMRVWCCDDHGTPVAALNVSAGKAAEETVVIDRAQFPFRGYMMLRAELDGMKRAFFVRVDYDAGELPEWRPAGSMLALLDELHAIDAIPRCAKKGFSRPGDSIEQRLSAFLCSYHSGEGEYYRRVLTRIGQINEYIGRDTPQAAMRYYMTEAEKRKLDRLENLCREGGRRGWD